MSRKSKAAEFLQEAYNITVSGRNVMVTESMKDYAIEKVSRIERFSNRIIDINITMDLQKLEHRVDIVIKVNQIKIKSSAASTDMYVSIDMAVDKIETQLLKYKDKLQDHHAKGVAAIDMNVNVLRATPEDEIMDLSIDGEEESRQRILDKFNPHRIVKQESRPLKMLTDGEALMKIDLSGDSFLIYLGEEDQHIKIIYRREDGDYGVIEPEASF